MKPPTIPLVSWLVLGLLGATPSVGQDISRHDVVWKTPSTDAHGSMPLGNGDITVNAWIEPQGDLLLYVGKSDSWDAHGRLLKVGRLRVTLDPALPTSDFEQRLDLEEGVMFVRAGRDEQKVEMRLWVDANHPVVCIEAESASPRTATVVLEPWRTARQAIPHAEVSDTFEDPSQPNRLHRTVYVDPDVLLDGPGDRIGWYHHSTEASTFAEMLAVQGIAEAFRGKPYPLSDRVFGAVVTADRGQRVDAGTLRAAAGTTHRIDVHVRTEHPSTPEKWLAAMKRQIAATGRTPIARARDAHRDWWREFWQRSWIEVTSGEPSRPALIPKSAHLVRIGMDQHGQNKFVGGLGRVSIFGRGATASDIARWNAAAPHELLSDAEKALFTDVGSNGAPIASSDDWDLSNGLSIEAWVHPGVLPAGGARIVDRITPGASDGWLLDTHPGNGLRFIVGPTIVRAENVLPPDTWTHVCASADATSGLIAIFVNGVSVASQTVDTSNDAEVVSRGYALQRYMNACAGRGRHPIKFNGSTYTVPHEGAWGDADYRRWGPGYWWQNTRLPYLSMCASGDFDLMRPLFRMYVDDMMPVNLLRTRQHTGHGGLYIPECVYFWGGQFPESYGWTPLHQREGDGLQTSRWHRWEWVSGLELAWMMLDYYEHTQDETFLRERVLPLATEVLRFFIEHYGVDDQGKLVMEPSQALETWWDTTNPMPEVAGLQAVSARLLALPDRLTPAEMRVVWERVRACTPPLPTWEVDGVRMLAPAARFADKSNVENPELYAVFPFRLVSFEKETRDLGVRALVHRWDRGATGWRQDDLFMTHLGLAEQARENLVARARSKHEGSRFPAFWGPNYDWIPDQDHGGVLMRTLQTMLMQTEGRTIYLLPAWPEGWNASFKLHAPYETTVSGRVEDGRLVEWIVAPDERRADVIVRGR